MWKPISILLIFLFLLTSCSPSSPTIGSTYFSAEDLTGSVKQDTSCYLGPDPRFGIAAELNQNLQISIVGASEGGKYAAIEDPATIGKLCWVKLETIDIKSTDLVKAFEMVSIIHFDSSESGLSNTEIMEAFLRLNLADPDSNSGTPHFEKVPVVLDCTRNSTEEKEGQVKYCDPENEPSFFETFFQIFSDETGFDSEDEPGFLETFFQEFNDEPEDESSETVTRTLDDQECIPLPTATPKATLTPAEYAEVLALKLASEIIIHGWCGGFICHTSGNIDDFHTECGELVYPVFYFPKEECSEKSGCVISTPPPVEFIPCTPVPDLPAPIILNLTLCWNGPGTGYEVISSIEANTTVEVLGMGVDGDHIVIINPRYNRPCWVKETDIELNDLNLAGMPIYGIPEQDKPADSPAKGCWVKGGRSDAPVCVKPCPDSLAYPDTCEP